MAELLTKVIRGEKIVFEVDSAGTFSAMVIDHGYVTGKTLAEVEAEVDRVIRKQKAGQPVEVTIIGAVPYADGQQRRWNSNGGDFDYAEGHVIDLTLRGYSERTRELLVTLTGGKKKKLNQALGAVRVLRQLTPQEVFEYQRLIEAKRNALVAIEDFINERKFDWEAAFVVDR